MDGADPSQRRSSVTFSLSPVTDESQNRKSGETKIRQRVLSRRDFPPARLSEHYPKGTKLETNMIADNIGSRRMKTTIAPVSAGTFLVTRWGLAAGCGRADGGCGTIGKTCAVDFLARTGHFLNGFGSGGDKHMC